MTLKECKKIHKEMWEYVRDNMPIEPALDTAHKRNLLKFEFCDKTNLSLANNCACCEYARESSGLQNFCGSCCQFCPAVWGTEKGNLEDYFCDTLDPDFLCWQASNFEDIINIKWKEEEE